MRTLLLFTSIVFCLFLAACDTGTRSSIGFSLPDGDAEQGRAVYTQLQCAACHEIDGVPQNAGTAEPAISVALGGTVHRIKTYGELVTSVINPSHRLASGYAEETIQADGKSLMRNYNSVMTVDELIDLVAFLQSKYNLQKFTPTKYRGYYPMG